MKEGNSGAEFCRSFFILHLSSFILSSNGSLKW
jgi:hypothetical protein